MFGRVRRAFGFAVAALRVAVGVTGAAIVADGLRRILTIVFAALFSP